MTEHNSDSPSLKELATSNLAWLLIPIFGLWLVALVLALTYKSINPFNALGALLSGLAFVGYLLALLYQSQQIKMQRLQGERQSEQIEMQRSELALQREELKLQREELKMHRAEFARTANAQEEASHALQEQRELMARTARLQALEAIQKGLAVWLKEEAHAAKLALGKLEENVVNQINQINPRKKQNPRRMGNRDGYTPTMHIVEFYAQFVREPSRAEVLQKLRLEKKLPYIMKNLETVEDFIKKHDRYQEITDLLLEEMKEYQQSNVPENSSNHKQDSESARLPGNDKTGKST